MFSLNWKRMILLLGNVWYLVFLSFFVFRPSFSRAEMTGKTQFLKLYLIICFLVRIPPIDTSIWCETLHETNCVEWNAGDSEKYETSWKKYFLETTKSCYSGYPHFEHSLDPSGIRLHQWYCSSSMISQMAKLARILAGSYICWEIWKVLRIYKEVHRQLNHMIKVPTAFLIP